MGDLERNSHSNCGCPLARRQIRPGRMRHASGEILQRHRHDVAFAAVVLAGSYVEAGDTGLHRVSAGDVVLHRPYEAHLDRFDSAGAEVLTLQLPQDFSGGSIRRIADPDQIVRLAERDAQAAVGLLIEQSSIVERIPSDWPAMLASDLLIDPDLPIRKWAYERGLHPGSVGRAFRQHFGLTAAAFRSNVRAHRALREILGSHERLAGVAAASGFVDQPHMNRRVRLLTAKAPGALRRAARDVPAKRPAAAMD